jgi:hypothetical protein
MIFGRIAQMRTGDRRGVLNLLRPPSGLLICRPVATGPACQIAIGQESRKGWANGDK